MTVHRPRPWLLAAVLVLVAVGAVVGVAAHQGPSTPPPAIQAGSLHHDGDDDQARQPPGPRPDAGCG